MRSRSSAAWQSTWLPVLALTGGALSAVVVEEMVSEAHEGETSQFGPVFLTARFAQRRGRDVRAQCIRQGRTRATLFYTFSTPQRGIAWYKEVRTRTSYA